jgi:hypothetical protein
MKKEDRLSIRKSHIFYTIIAVFLFLLGIFIGSFFLSWQTQSETVEKCRKFCDFIPNTEFSHVGEKNHCFCIQSERLVDSSNNKTMEYTKIVDAGIITEVKIEDYLEG